MLVISIRPAEKTVSINFSHGETKTTQKFCLKDYLKNIINSIKNSVL